MRSFHCDWLFCVGMSNGSWSIVHCASVLGASGDFAAQSQTRLRMQNCGVEKALRSEVLCSEPEKYKPNAGKVVRFYKRIERVLKGGGPYTIAT
jgi:hypothetical protein